jgi:ubiquinone/menaquinone biosynthesis C-methylase UbiE
MSLARMLHGEPSSATPGVTLSHGRRYDRFTATFFLGRRGRAFDKLAELSGARAGDRVLDVGCGTGFLARRLAAAVGGDAVAGRGGQVVGIDASPDMIEHARASAVSAGAELTFAVGVAEALDFGDAEFDVVTSSLMLHHLPSDLRHQALSEMHRVLRPGGRVLVADFRPPNSRLARRALSAVTGAGMQNQPVDDLPELFTRAGMLEVRSGELPWMRYVVGVKAGG